MTVVAVIQARMSSTRMPEKVMQPILGKPMLLHQIERVAEAERLDRIIIATSTDASDDPIAALTASPDCQSRSIDCYRGALDDVLSRFAGVARRVGAEHIVRLTGDCPLSDPKIIDAVIDQHLNEKADYTSNVMHPTLPDGFDVEVCRQSVLLEADSAAVKPSEREHVMPYITQRGDRFRNISYEYKRDLSHLRLTVDHPEDFELVTHIFEHLYPIHPRFGVDAVAELLERHPEWLALNHHIDRNEGYKKSLLDDEQYLNQQRHQTHSDREARCS